MPHFADAADAAGFAADKMQKHNLFTTERLFCDVYCFEPGQAQAPHSHAGSDKVYYVLEGTARIRVGELERAAAAPAGMAHGVYNPGPDRLRVLVVMAPKP
jgi:mannose-6-phosphate isomerase-like protein (cupin superfamily)